MGAAAAIPLIGGAVLGGIQGAEEEKRVTRMNKAAAEGNKFADITGHRTAMQDPGGGAFGGALKGASTFGALGSALGGAGGGPQTDIGQDFIQNKGFGGATVGGEVPQNVFGGGFGQQRASQGAFGRLRG